MTVKPASQNVPRRGRAAALALFCAASAFALGLSLLRTPVGALSESDLGAAPQLTPQAGSSAFSAESKQGRSAFISGSDHIVPKAAPDKAQQFSPEGDILPSEEDSEPLSPVPQQPACLFGSGSEPISAAQLAEEAALYVPHVWPVQFGEAGYISSYFGWRKDPETDTHYEMHLGLDLADHDGTRITAAAAGTVISVADSSSFGKNLVIDHGNGYQTRYSHCSSIPVEEGDAVQQGQVIAFMGRSGRVTGSHCDFRVYLDGVAVDPLTVLDPRS